MLAQEGSFMRKRGGFATKHVWVTPLRTGRALRQRRFPNQHAGGDGLPSYVAQNRDIENTGHRALALVRPHPCLQRPKTSR